MSQPFRSRKDKAILALTGWLPAGIIALAVLAMPDPFAELQAQPGRPVLAPGRPAPELAGGTDWLGVNQPLSLRELRGKFVILDFWTLC